MSLIRVGEKEREWTRMKRNPFPGRDEAGRGLCWGEKNNPECFAVAEKNTKKTNKQEQHEQLKINGDFCRYILANPVRTMLRLTPTEEKVTQKHCIQ